MTIDIQKKWAGEKELREYQFERIHAVLFHAASIPFYRDKFSQAGFSPAQFRTLADIEKIPVLTKAELISQYPRGLWAEPMEKIRRVHSSSGSTGTPLLVPYTETDLRIWAQAMARALREAGLGPKDVIAITHGYGLFTGGLGVHAGAEEIGCTILPSSTGRTSLQARLIRDLGATVLVGTPSYLLRLSEEFSRQGISHRELRLRLCICGAEPWSEAMRAEIEARLGVEALDLYGMAELMGPGVASETRESKGALVFWEDLFFPEIIDDELIVTALHKEAMPILRYRTGDKTRFHSRNFSAFRAIERVSRRSGDFIKIRGVGIEPAAIESFLFRNFSFSGHYQIELSTKDQMDQICVSVEAPLLAEGSEVSAETLARQLFELTGIRVEAKILAPGTLDSAGSKAQRIRDLRSMI